ncbi:MAG: ABC transporter ATP-binding protein [Aestuariivirgaceae bacterium]
MNAVSIDITSKHYAGAAGPASGHLAISGLTFDVAGNEFVCVLGPSGCGKTTLLNLIAGIDDDYAGRISLAEDALQSLAYVFQTPRLLPWRTVTQNVALVAGDDDQLVAGLLQSVGIEGFAQNFPGELSLGMQRRVALARAFARKPSLLLMDEPFVSLDPDAASELRQLLKRILSERPATVIFVTHDHREAVQLADRIVVLSGAPAKVVKDVPVKMDAGARSSPAKVGEFIERHLR